MILNFIDASDPAFRAAAQAGTFKGAVKNLLNSDYHALKKYWSSSQLKFMYETSPRHFHAEYVRPQAATDQSKAKAIGSLVHTLTLEPDHFVKEFFIMPSLNLRTNEGKARKEELLALHAGKTPVTDDDLVTANLMRASLEFNSQIKELLSSGIKEGAFFWSCPFSGLMMRAKLDQISETHFTELKTTRMIGAEEFSKQAYNLHYDLSLFHYREGARQVLDLEVPARFAVVENDWPHVSQAYKVPDWLFETGRDKWLTAVGRLEQALKTDKWIGYYPDDAAEIPELPVIPWAVKKHEVVT